MSFRQTCRRWSCCANSTRQDGVLWGRFRTARAQREHSANYYVVYPGNSPEKHPPTEACLNNSKQHWDAEFRTLGPVASIRLKKKTLVYQQGL